MMMAALVLATIQPQYKVERIQGWTLYVRTELIQSNKVQTETAKRLLEKQLNEICGRVPSKVVQKLKKVKLWFSPEYEGIRPAAEYHPNANWLKEHQRDPDMAKGVEFTNIRIFERESRRMPNFALHELAHAFHDQFLPSGFENPAIKSAFTAAKKSGNYEQVARRDADGNETKERHYAMTNQMEFFAELSESFFSINDFGPFDRIQLGLFDSNSARTIREAWGISEVERPPANMKLSSFYGKYFDADGFPVLASSKVNDYALREAGYLINLLLAKRPDLKRAMVEGGSRMVVIGHNQWTTDVPEYKWLKPKDFWDARARGLGGSETDPLCSCAEENVLGFPGDPYAAESIVIHEFAHSIHLRGLNAVDAAEGRTGSESFDSRLEAAFQSAMKAGLWKGKYASTNRQEYFAEGVQSWFDNNRQNDSSHNHVNTRAELIEYDPMLGSLCREVFGDTQVSYTKPATRLTGHMSGHDPTTAPTFHWPKRLRKAREDIKRDAEQRSNGGGLD